MQQNASECNSGENTQKLDASNPGCYPNLRETQLQAIDWLLHGLSDAEVAAKLNVDRSTIFRWRKTEAFARRLRILRERLFEQSAARISMLVQPSLEILRRQLKGPDEKAAARAASTLLRLATNARICGGDFESRKPKTKRSTRSREITPAMQAIEDYINAPMPGQTKPSGLTPKFKW
jgi:hypothetical protein